MPLCINELSNLGWLITLPSSIYRVFEAVAGVTLFFIIIIFFSLFLWCNFPSFFFFEFGARQQQSSLTYWKWIAHPVNARPIWLAILYFISLTLSLFIIIFSYTHTVVTCAELRLFPRGAGGSCSNKDLFGSPAASLSLSLFFSRLSTPLLLAIKVKISSKKPRKLFFFSLSFFLFFFVLNFRHSLTVGERKRKKNVNAIFGHDTWKQLRNDNKTTNWRGQDAMITIATYEKSGGGEKCIERWMASNFYCAYYAITSSRNMPTCWFSPLAVSID